MAVRNKTIEYAFPLSTADVASNTARDFTATTIFIPETTSRTFRSVVLEVFVHDNGNAASLTAVLMGISLGAVARNDATVTQTITNSGENQSFIFTRDVTDYFVTNWTGTSMSAGCRLTATGVGTRNASAKLTITYEYDDTVTTQIKTVKIPVEGNTGNLTTSLASLGNLTGQLPALDTFLPEDSKVYRDIFFEIYTHTGQTGGTTDRALNMRYNGVTTISSTNEGGLTSDFALKRIDKISGSFSTNTAYDIEASTANTDTPFPCLSGILTVTYEFNADNTTAVMNSLFLPIIDEDGFIPSGSMQQSRFAKTIYIQEPDIDIFTPISLEQSALLFSCIDAGAVTIQLSIGQYGAMQTPTNYVHAATPARCGAMYMMCRFDAGAIQNPGISLVRGANTILVDYSSTSNTDGSRGSNASGVLILNYKSGKSSQGIGAHNHTTCWNLRAYQTATLSQQLIFTGTRTPIIPETNYWITCNGMELKLLTTGGTAGSLATAFQAEIDVTELDQSFVGEYGWVNYYSSMYNSDPEIGPSIIWNTCKSTFKQWPQDERPGRYLNEINTRTYRYDQLTAIAHLQAQKYLTYHSITCSIAGTVSNFTNQSQVYVYPYVYDGGGNYLQNTMPWTGSTVSSPIDSSGNYSFTWYNDQENIQVAAVEYAGGGDVLYSGVSKIQYPTDGITFDIAFEAGQGPTYYSYG